MRHDSITIHGLIPSVGGPFDDVLGAEVLKLTEILTRHDRESAAIKSDAGLNAFGKQQRLSALQRSTAAALDATSESRFGVYSRSQVKDEVARLRKTLAERFEYEPSETNGVPGLRHRIPKEERDRAELRQREIRDRLLALDPVRRVEVARTAAASNDLETLLAIKRAPVAFPILNADEWADVERQHLQKHHAADLARIDALEQLESTLNFNLNGARKAIGAGPPDPIKAALKQAEEAVESASA